MPDFFYVKRAELENGAHASFIFVDTQLLYYGLEGQTPEMKTNFVNAGWDSPEVISKQLAWIDKALEDANKDEFVFLIGHHLVFECAKNVPRYFIFLLS